MAAKEELKHLTCSICLEIFTEPKLLPCLHRFCESCLDDYIKKSDDDESGFLCPVCRAVTTAPDTTRTRSTWASIFKTDFLIKEIISSRLGEPSRIQHPCPTHVDIECDYYCADCSQIMCHRCALASHRRCEEVMTLPAAANQRKAPLEAKIHEISSQLKGREQWQHFLNKYHKSIDDKASLLEARIEEWSEQRQQRVQDYEEKLLEQMGRVCKTLKEKLQSEVKTVQEAEDQVQCRVEAAVVKLSSSDADIMLENFVDDAIESFLQEDLDGAIKNMHINSENMCNVDIDFQQFHDAATINRSGLWIEIAHGTVNPEGKSQENTSDIELKTAIISDNIQVLGTIFVRNLTNDHFSGCIDAMFVVGPHNTIIVTNFVEQCITTLSNRGEKCTSLTLPGRPLGITQISKTLLAVSLSDLRQICIIEFSPRLRVTSCVQYEEAYRTLDSLTSTTFVAGCAYSPPIHIINLHGQVLKTISIDTVNGWGNGCVCSICVTSDKRILYLNGQRETLVCISQDGEIQFKYTSLRGPLGVACDSSGGIMLLNYEELISLSSDGQFMKTLVRCQDIGLDWFRSVAVDTAGLVYLTDHKCVKILKIK